MKLAKIIAAKTPFYYGWVILATAGSTQLIRNVAATLTLAIFLYPMSNDLGWSRTMIAGAASAGGLLASVTAPLVGWLIDKYGTRIILSISIVLLSLSTFLSSWVTMPIMFFATYGVGRVIFNSPIQIGASVLVSRWFIQRRGRANGILAFCHSVGMTLFPLLASVLIAFNGWQFAWQILGLIAALAIFPVLLLTEDYPESIGVAPDKFNNSNNTDYQNQDVNNHLKEPAWSLKNALKTPVLWQISFGGFLLYLIHGGTNTHLAAYFQDLSLGSRTAGFAISLIAIFTGLGSLLWGWLSEKLSINYCYAAISGIMAVTSFMFTTVETTYQAWTFSSLLGLSLGGLLVVPPVAVANYFGRKSLGVIRGFCEPFYSTGQAIGVLIGGISFDLWASYDYSFFVLAIAGIAALITTITATIPSRFEVSN